MNLFSNKFRSAGGGDITLPEIKTEVHHSIDFAEESMTGMIGTALYVAPELMTTTTKALYNQV